MSTDEAAGTRRVALMLGAEGLAVLRRSHVLVLGLGGVGSNCAEALARSGVGCLTVIDGDVVDVSNVNRQAVAFHSTVGQPKARVMQRIIHDINPQAQVSAQVEHVLPAQAAQLLEDKGLGCPDVCIDCIDTVTSKVVLARACEERGVHFLSSMGEGNKYHPELLRFADIYETSVCPFARAVRKAARKHGVRHMRVLYSLEPPLSIPIETREDRAAHNNIGTLSYLPALFGQMLAGDCIRTLLGVEAP